MLAQPIHWSGVANLQNAPLPSLMWEATETRVILLTSTLHTPGCWVWLPHVPVQGHESPLRGSQPGGMDVDLLHALCSSLHLHLT